MVERLVILKSDNNIRVCLNTKQFVFSSTPAHTELMRYYKSIHRTSAILMNRLFAPMKIALAKIDADDMDLVIDDFQEFVDKVMEVYDDVIPFTYKEAFQIENDGLRALVFGSINVGEMIANLGHKMHKVDGILLTQKSYSPEGEYLGEYELNNIYEVHEVNATDLTGRDGEKVYAVKCWCTSTNNEHWIWIDEAHKDDPLTAIASTFRFHKSVIPQIKALKRQGDIMLVEMKQDVDIDPEEEIVPLTKDEYFSLLVAQS